MITFILIKGVFMKNRYYSWKSLLKTIFILFAVDIAFWAILKFFNVNFELTSKGFAYIAIGYFVLRWLYTYTDWGALWFILISIYFIFKSIYIVTHLPNPAPLVALEGYRFFVSVVAWKNRSKC